MNCLNQFGRVALVLGMTVGAFAQDGPTDRAKDRRDIRHDQRDINHDKRDIRNDVKNGQYKDAQKDIRDLRHDRKAAITTCAIYATTGITSNARLRAKRRLAEREGFEHLWHQKILQLADS